MIHYLALYILSSVFLSLLSFQREIFSSGLRSSTPYSTGSPEPAALCQREPVLISTWVMLFGLDLYRRAIVVTWYQQQTLRENFGGEQIFSNKKKKPTRSEVKISLSPCRFTYKVFFLISYIFWLWCLGENNSAFPVGWWPSWREKKMFVFFLRERKRISNAADGSIWFWTRSAF